VTAAELPSTMLAAVLHGRDDLRLETVPVPSPGPGEVLLAVTACGVCGTDAAEWAHGPFQIPLESPHPVTGHSGPMVIGHEFAGRVVALGEGVGAEWLGRLVASAGAAACGHCELCLGGRSNVCRRYSVVGLHRDGALAAYATAPLASCIDVGALGIGELEAALVQPMAIAVHALRRGGVVAGDTAVVQGVGGVGAFLVHALKQSGARVVAVDLDPGRLEAARELGADVTVLGGQEDSARRITQEFPAGLPVFFEVTGSDAGLQLALELVPVGSTVVLVGIAKAPRTLDMGRVTVRELTLVGTNGIVRETELEPAAALVASRAGRWSTIAPEPLPLAEVVTGALQPIAQGRPPAIKTLIRPTL